MKIYGINIKMPHSGDLTRSQVLTVLTKDIKNNYNGVGDFSKDDLKNECKKYNTFLMDDTNYELGGSLN